jgi:hypothetical protein
MLCKGERRALEGAGGVKVVNRFLHKNLACRFVSRVCRGVVVREALGMGGRAAKSRCYRSADGRKFDTS